MRIVGIDPGVQGALTLFDVEARTADIQDMPLEQFTVGSGSKLKHRNAVCAPLVLAWLSERLPIDHVYIEKVGVRPGEGAVGAFAFGVGYGKLLGVIAALKIPYHEQHPQVWKRRMKLSADKDEVRAQAMRLLPHFAEAFKLKKHDGRAESALLALYGFYDQEGRW